MEKTNLISVSLDNVSIGDTIYLSRKEDSVPFLVLDKGTPFILIENMNNHFATLFRPTKDIYKLNFKTE